MLILSLTIFFFGLALGSYANCLIWRLYKGETTFGHSYCPHCRHELSWKDNIPLYSFFSLHGRCRYCRQPISWQYPLVEAAVGLLFLFFWLRHTSEASFSYDAFLFLARESSFWLLLVRDLIAAWVLTVVFVFDLRYFLVSTSLSAGAALVFLAINLLLGADWLLSFILILSGAAFFGIQYLATKGKGIGEGDIWLGGMMGALFMHANQLVLAVFATYMFGLLAALGLLLAGKKSLSSKLPLGVFIALGTLFALAFGGRILESYWHYFQL
ncbi:MAG: prepilin peptidase [Bacillota bacterium]